MTEHRLLGHAEAKITGAVGLLLLFIALAGFAWPLAVSIPLAVFCCWLALSLLIRTHKFYFRKKQVMKVPGKGEKGPARQ